MIQLIWNLGHMQEDQERDFLTPLLQKTLNDIDVQLSNDDFEDYVRRILACQQKIKYENDHLLSTFVVVFLTYLSLPSLPGRMDQSPTVISNAVLRCLSFSTLTTGSIQKPNFEVTLFTVFFWLLDLDITCD